MGMLALYEFVEAYSPSHFELGYGEIIGWVDWAINCDWDDDGEWYSPCNPCEHVDNCIVCYPNAPGYSGFDHYIYWYECAEMGMEYYEIMSITD